MHGRTPLVGNGRGRGGECGGFQFAGSSDVLGERVEAWRGIPPGVAEPKLCDAMSWRSASSEEGVPRRCDAHAAQLDRPRGWRGRRGTARSRRPPVSSRPWLIRPGLPTHRRLGWPLELFAEPVLGHPERIGPDLSVGAIRASEPLERSITRRLGEFDRLVERIDRPGEVIESAQGRCRGDEGHRSPERSADPTPSDRRRRFTAPDVVASIHRTSPRRRQSDRRPSSYRVRALVGWTELRRVHMCLLEVVSDDLLLLADGVTGHMLQPLREALVELGPPRLRDRLVRGVTDEEMPESNASSPASVDRSARTSSFRASARRSDGTRSRVPSGTRSETAPRKNALTDHGRCLEHRSRSSGVSRSTRAARSALIDGGTVTLLTSPVAEFHRPPSKVTRPSSISMPRFLLDEQRVALGGSSDAFRHVGRKVPPTNRCRISTSASARGEWLE